jgi:hypothetical protein
MRGIEPSMESITGERALVALSLHPSFGMKFIIF